MGTKERLTYVYGLLNEVIPGNVHYALYVTDNAEPPFIVYQELNKNPKVYADDSYLIRQVTIQITLVTKTKDTTIESSLEEVLQNAGIDFRMISEYSLVDTGIYRIYEIKMEEYNNEQ